MVDKESSWTYFRLQNNMSIFGRYHIDHDDQVHVQGDVEYDPRITELRIQFGTVSGSFSRECTTSFAPHLITLEGFPRKVGSINVNMSRIKNLHHAPNQVLQDFYASFCDRLVSLQGAPRWVGRNFDVHGGNLSCLQGAPLVVKGVFRASGNPLQSYDHLPQGCSQLILPYNLHAPLLKLCDYPSVMFTFDGVTKEFHPEVGKIMDRYVGKGRSGALLAAAELIRAGYQENARW